MRSCQEITSRRAARNPRQPAVAGRSVGPGTSAAGPSRHLCRGRVTAVCRARVQCVSRRVRNWRARNPPGPLYRPSVSVCCRRRPISTARGRFSLYTILFCFRPGPGRLVECGCPLLFVRLILLPGSRVQYGFSASIYCVKADKALPVCAQPQPQHVHT